MQTSKSKASTIEVPSKTSPKTPRTARQIKTTGSGSEQVSSSPNKANRVNKDRSPKVIERRTPQSPISEKKHQSKASDLESEIVKLQEDLKLARDKMVSSELLKEQAELEAEDAKKQLLAMTTKLGDTEKQQTEMSQYRDTILESELEAAQKQHSVDSVETFSALDEIHKPKLGAEQVNPAGSAHDEFRILRSEHEKAVAMVEALESKLGESKKSEAQMLENLKNTQCQLEVAVEENKTLKLGGSIALNNNNAIALELEESKAKVNALEILVSKLQANLVTYGDSETGKNERSVDDTQHCLENGINEEIEQLKSEIMNLKYEDCKLRAALEAAEMKYQEVRLQSALDARSAYEEAENTRSDLRTKEAELQKATSDIKELQAKLAEMGFLNDAEKDQRRQIEISFTALQETLTKKDILLPNIEKENESLKQEVQKLEMQKKEVIDGSAADNLAQARADEQKAISKFEYLTNESDKNSKRMERVIEQLDAAQAVNAELESELRKLKVQSDQWRKAAEAAAAMLTSGNNGKYIDRTGSLDSGYHTLGGRISSPFSDDLNDESVKKKNGNMLKKIGVLWKKGQNQK